VFEGFGSADSCRGVVGEEAVEQFESCARYAGESKLGLVVAVDLVLNKHQMDWLYVKEPNSRVLAQIHRPRERQPIKARPNAGIRLPNQVRNQPDLLHLRGPRQKRSME